MLQENGTLALYLYAESRTKMSSLETRLLVRSGGERCQLEPLRRGARGSASRPVTSSERSHACTDPVASTAPYDEALWQGLATPGVCAPLRPS